MCLNNQLSRGVAQVLQGEGYIKKWEEIEDRRRFARWDIIRDEKATTDAESQNAAPGVEMHHAYVRKCAFSGGNPR